MALCPSPDSPKPSAAGMVRAGGAGLVLENRAKIEKQIEKLLQNHHRNSGARFATLQNVIKT